MSVSGTNRPPYGPNRVSMVTPVPSSRPRSRRAASWSACSTAAKNSRSRFASLMPGTHSTPLETSTATGCRAAIAAVTLAGFRPPARTRSLRGVAGSAASSSQSSLRPVPPYTPGALASSRTKSASSTSGVSTAAMTTGRRSVSAAASRTAATEGPSAPADSCTAPRPAVSTAAAIHAGVWFVTTATVSASPAAAARSRALAGTTCRGLSASTKPTAQAPSSTARRTSSGRVKPQIFTRVILATPDP